MKPNRSPLRPLIDRANTSPKDLDRAKLAGLEVTESDFIDWLEAGGQDRRKTPRDSSDRPDLGKSRPRFL